MNLNPGGVLPASAIVMQRCRVFICRHFPVVLLQMEQGLPRFAAVNLLRGAGGKSVEIIMGSLSE
jgi:hypothetical protein